VVPNSLVCIDAGVLVKLVVEDPHSARADALWDEWTRQQVAVIAPALLPFEVTAALRKYVYHELLSEEAAQQSLRAALTMGVLIEQPPNLHSRALTLAGHYNWVVTYDAHYLALAEHYNCPLWTTDQRLVNTVRSEFPAVHWLGEVPL